MSELLGNLLAGQPAKLDPDAASRVRVAGAEVNEARLYDKSEGFYLFYSFDLAGSTQFKTRFPKIWPEVVQKFYATVLELRETRLKATQFWKFVGDEVLLYRKVNNFSELATCVDDAHLILSETISVLQSGYPETRQELSVKGTLWSAETGDMPAHELQLSRGAMRNLVWRPVVSSPEPPGKPAQWPQADFLGPDVDIGFRISRFALRSRLVISAELAFFLSGTPKAAEMSIVSYQKLPGVWEGRGYPIIWHEPCQDQFLESFEYDEHLNSDFLREVSRTPLTSGVDALNKVFEDRGCLEAMLEAKKQAEALEQPEERRPASLDPRARYAEVHCVAVCLTDDGGVLVAKRSDVKTRLPGKWEFGCAQLGFNEGFEECLRRGYRDTFGVDLDFGPGSGVRPRPIDTFMLNDGENGRVIPGLVFVARVANASEGQLRLSEGHSEVLWLKVPALPFMPEECVPNFAETVELARSAFSAIWSN